MSSKQRDGSYFLTLSPRPNSKPMGDFSSRIIQEISAASLEKMKIKALSFNGGTSLISSPFPFYIRHSSHLSTKIDVPRHLFLDSVRDHCKLGFSDFKFPLPLFNQLISLRPLPSIVIFNQLFTSISKLKRLHPHSTIISLSSHLQLLGIRFERHSFGILANCYCHLGRVDFGFSIMAKSLKLGFPPNHYTFCTLINGYIINGKLPQAAQLLNKIVKLGFQPDVATYGAIFKGLCRIGDNASALTLLAKMQSASRCKPGLVIYNTIIDSLCKDRLLQQAMDLFSAMKAEGIQPGVVTYNTLIRGHYNSGCREEAKDLLTEMLKTNISPNVATYSMLVDMFCKDGNVEEAQATMQLMTHKGVAPDIITYNALLDGYCLRGQMRDAKKILDIMAQKGCEPDLVSFSTMINGYVKRKNIDKALTVLENMFQKGITPTVVTYCTLIDGLCKANRLTDMQVHGVTPDVVTYSSLLDGLWHYLKIWKITVLSLILSLTTSLWTTCVRLSNLKMQRNSSMILYPRVCNLIVERTL